MQVVLTGFPFYLKIYQHLYPLPNTCNVHAPAIAEIYSLT